MMNLVKKMTLLMMVLVLILCSSVYAADENVALDSTVTASSSFAPEYDAKLAVDGIKQEFGKGEWASLGEIEPWIKLEWDNSVEISKIIIYDRENTLDNAQGGVIEFSDGSSLEVSGIDGTGNPTEFTFSPKTISWLKFDIKGDGANVGLSEIEVYGKKVECDTSSSDTQTNPKTGDIAGLGYVMTAIAAGAGLVIAKRKHVKK